MYLSPPSRIFNIHQIIRAQRLLIPISEKIKTRRGVNLPG